MKEVLGFEAILFTVDICLAHFIFRFSFWLTKLQKTKVLCNSLFSFFIIFHFCLALLALQTENHATYFRFS